ncbi:MAG: hypothetical protein IPJ85_14990 [Flavobacteriales bacterium]|nr:hypothetical protein [Flavobacteriales bacterium]
MDKLLDMLWGVHEYFYRTLGMGNAFYYAVGFIVVIALLAQWRLYEKCRLPGLAAFVPVWNIVVFMRIVGRPASDGWKMLIPIWGQLYFIPKVWIEVISCFGKTSLLDKILVIGLNGLYILNLALSDDQYLGPLRGQQPLPKAHKVGRAHPQMA